MHLKSAQFKLVVEVYNHPDCRVSDDNYAVLDTACMLFHVASEHQQWRN